MTARRTASDARGVDRSQEEIDVGPVELVVLDVAGTTVADGGVVPRAVDDALTGAGLAPADPATLRPLRGMAKSDLFAQLAPDPRTAASVHDAFVRLVLEAVAAGEMSARPGAGDLLQACRDVGVVVSLMTGFEAPIQRALLATLGWAELVDITVAPSGSLRGRPWPDMVLSAMLEARVGSVRSVLVAGDTVNDVWAGSRAGAGAVVGVLGGAHRRSELESAPHTDIVEGLDELRELILSWAARPTSRSCPTVWNGEAARSGGPS